MSEAMSEVPLTYPMRAAWEKYKDTDDYVNARKWATHDLHADGSLWAAFCKGWDAAHAERPASLWTRFKNRRRE